VRKERVGLEDGVHVAAIRREPRHVAVTEEDRPRRRLLEAADHPKGRRLPAPGRAQKREEGAPRDRERDVVDRDDVCEPLGHALEPDVGVGGREIAPAGRRLASRLLAQGHQSIFAITCLMAV
jgi:hypothetical protein